MKKIAILTLICVLSSCISGPQGPKQPKTAQDASSEQTKNQENQTTIDVKSYSDSPVVNVYLETSGSMNGYVDNGRSQFQQVVFDYLSNIQNCGQFSGMNLNYITDKITPKGSDVNKFINSLTSNGLINAAGSKATTDIAALIDSVLKRTSGEQVSIFISDCIFSPGSVSNPEAYLENQKIAIRNAVKSYIDRIGSAGCMVYQLSSHFKGSYFDYKNRAKRVNLQRPFYIWVFGSPYHLATIKANVPDNDFMGAKVENTWTIINILPQNDYGLLQPSPTNGDYKWKSKTDVTNIKKNTRLF